MLSLYYSLLPIYRIKQHRTVSTAHAYDPWDLDIYRTSLALSTVRHDPKWHAEYNKENREKGAGKYHKRVYFINYFEKLNFKN